MGLLKKPYEISLWEDVWDNINKKFDETRTLTIGSSEMEYLGRAIEPNLVRKTNGEVSFSFKMYYQFVDTTTGETVNNPFVDYIANETKVKLKHGDEWFDLLVKNVHKDSATKSYTYQLVDQHMTELSKNGFDVQLDSKLFNNLGTAEELGRKVLQNTDWGVDSEKIVQTQDEALVMLTLPDDLSDYGIYQINDENLSTDGAVALAIWPPDIEGKPIYAFYSSCSGDKPYRFQFIYKETDKGEEEDPRYVYDSFETYSDRIIADQNCQYYIDGIAEWTESNGFTIPVGFTFDEESREEAAGNKSAISMLYRGRRYVYSQTSEYHPGLDMYLEKYKGAATNTVDGYFKYNTSEAAWKSWGELGTEDTWSYYADGHKPEDENVFPVGTIVKVENLETSYEPIYLLVTNSLIQSQVEGGSWYSYKATVIDSTSTEYYKYTKTEYVAPSLIQNIVNNAEFKGTSAWKGSKFLADGDAIIEDKPASSPEFSATVETVSMYDDGNVLADATDVMLGYTAVDDEGANWSSVIGNQNYKPYLRCGNLHNVNNMVRAIVNSGTSDTAAFQQGVTEGERYIFDIEAFSVTRQTRYVYGSDDQVESVRYISNSRLSPQIVVAKFDYDSSLNGYDIADYTNLGTSEDVLFQGFAEEQPVELAAKRTVTSEAMQESKYQIFLLPGDINPPSEWWNLGTKYRNEYFVLIKKIQFYKLYPKGTNGHYTPDDNLNATEVSYIVEDRYFPAVENDTRTLGKITFAPITNTFTPVLSADGSKKSTVNVKESNYFNAIQAIASTFECWPQLEVNHDATGKIVNFPSKNYSKRVHFKNYVGQKNHVGFKYGVNSKDIKRTIDSNQIVSKLIVKANSNEYAPNGFCTIARAPANSVKDNVLYNFDYYVSQQMLDATALQNDLYIEGDESELPQLRSALTRTMLMTEDQASDILVSCTGYYPKMRAINEKLENLQKIIEEKNAPLIAETATYNTYKAMYEAAVSGLEEQQDRFFKLAGCAYNAIPDNEKQEEIMNSATLLSTLQTIAELAATEQDAKAKYETAERNMEFYSRAISTQENRQKNALLLKEVLNNMFYTRYSRFIQEGTWIDESYLDESLYYNDALSVSYNSAMPKVTYSMNVLSLAGLPGYELFDFKVGDQTFVEDTEYFGYDTTGAPIRAEVTITQTSENLDDPTKNTIQIRNYENQFEDLFQRINATVQSVQYSEGSYKKAAEFVEADATHKFSFLNEALSAAEAYIGDTNNTVVVDTSGGTGITITDKNNAEQALRLTSGAILLKGTNPDTGEKVWKTGLTAEGISASLVNAGILNTGEINIMNGSEPTFRWDSHGITAYNFDNSLSDTFFGIDKTKGVRFDRFGLYGYSGINGETWHPTALEGGINSVDQHSIFALTWDGLKLTPQTMNYVGHYKDEEGEDLTVDGVPQTSRIKLGRVDDQLYNDWDDKGYPKYSHTSTGKKFVKIMSVGDIIENGDNEHVSENFILYSDGTLVAENLKLPGSIQWTEGSSPSKNVYGVSGEAPANGTSYNKFPDQDDPATESVEWHKVYNEEVDTHYCHTDNGGATWQGPFLITGRSIAGTIFQYQILEAGLSVQSLNNQTEGWLDYLPTTKLNHNEAMYIRTRERYNDGTYSDWRYLSSSTPVADLTLTATSLVVQEDQDGKLTPTKITLTASTQALSDDAGYTWTGVDNSNNNKTNSATFTTSGMSDTQIIKVEYGGFTDSVTIVKVKEGSDAISAILTNPTMVFNTADTNATEKTSVLVYRGSNPLPYGKANNNWYYTLAENSNKISINESGVITVTNPGTKATLSITLTIYKGSTTDTETQTLNINCTMVSNNLSISLTNDKGIVVTDKDGNNGGYGDNVKTSATVYDGGQASTGWTFAATSSQTSEADDLEFLQIDRNTFKITKLKVDSAVLTITATKGSGSSQQTLETSFPVSKLKQGESGTPGTPGTPGAPAISYWLVSSSPIIAKSAAGEYLTTSVTYTPMKQVGANSPEVAGNDVELVIWKDNDSEPELGQDDKKTGQQVIFLGDEDEEGKIEVNTALHCKMYLGEVMIDEQTTEVLSDGVTVTGIDYAIGSDGVTTPSAWGAYPNNIPQGSYLWTRTSYSNGDYGYSCSYIAMDGNEGNGISTVTNWYKRTSTYSKPQDPSEDRSDWQENSAPDYDPDEGNLYLWTCESTTYTKTGEKFTDVTLLSREPRNINSITEYYQVIDDDTIPDEITLDANNNSIETVGDWNTSFDAPSSGESLWNCEVIHYTTQDDNGQNEYAVTKPAKIGYIGIDGVNSYTLSLDNDVDTIVQTNTGAWVSGELTVTATGYVGHEQKTGLTGSGADNIGEISLDAPTGWTLNTHYTFTNNKLTINPSATTGTPHGVPTNFTQGQFKFKWKNGNDIYAEKTFSLKKTIENFDYDLIIPQVVYNSSQSGGTISVSVLKKGLDGTTTLTTASDDTSIKLLQKKMSGATAYYKESNWSVGYAQYRTEEIHFVLVKNGYVLGTPISSSEDPLYGYATFTTSPTIVWDEEVIEFTQDGASIKKLNTYSRSFTKEAWTGYAVIGHNEDWWVDETGGGEVTFTYDNSGLKIGDTAYIEGVVNNQKSSETGYQSITLYGEVIDIGKKAEYLTNIERSYVTLKTTSVIWGGTQGDSITVKTIEYQIGDNSTTAPTGTWVTTPPTLVQGKYLWTKTTFSDDSIAYSISYQSIDGLPAEDFNITASSYVLTKASPSATSYRESITLTPHLINLPSTSEVQWSSDNANWSPSPTLTVTAPGTYYAKITDTSWTDSVTIGEVIDGANGKDAIAIVLSNPTMTFHSNTANESETCEVIVYEGSSSLSATATSGARFSVTEKTDTQGVASVNGAVITIGDPGNNDGSAVFTVTVIASDGTQTTRDMTVNWVVVKNGTTPDMSPTACTITVYQKTTQQAIPGIPTDGTLGSWVESKPVQHSGLEYIYGCNVTKTVVYNGPTSSNIKSTTYANWGSPELLEAYTLNSKISGETWATYLKLVGTGGSTNSGLNYDTNGKLYIDASFINTGALRVGDIGAEIFSADFSNKAVNLAGWIAGRVKFQSNKNELPVLSKGLTGPNDNGVYSITESSILLSPEGSIIPSSIAGQTSRTWKLVVGNKFGVTSGGDCYATGGKIGGWTVEDSTLSSGNLTLYGNNSDNKITVVADKIENTTETVKIKTTKNVTTDSSGSVTLYFFPSDYIENENFKVDFNKAVTVNRKVVTYQSFSVSQDNIKIIASMGTLSVTISGLAVNFSDLYLNLDLEIEVQGTVSSQYYPFKLTNTGELTATYGTLGPSLAISQWKGYFTALGDPNALKITQINQNIKNDTLGSFFALGQGGNGAITFRSDLSASYMNSSTIAFGRRSSNNDSDTITTTWSTISSGRLSTGDIQLTFSGPVKFNKEVKNSGGTTQFTSDARLKNSIVTMPCEYDNLFDNLRPVIFKYNEGTSDRFHTGFIAQEVDKARETAGISRKDFSAICIDQEGTEDELWYVRYSNFIPINTWQIQKLKPRMSAAEEKIAQLELQVLQLTTELENLKKS